MELERDESKRKCEKAETEGREALSKYGCTVNEPIKADIIDEVAAPYGLRLARS